MVDLVPVLLFAFGLIALGNPDWVAAIDRRQKAAGIARRNLSLPFRHPPLVSLFGATGVRAGSDGRGQTFRRVLWRREPPALEVYSCNKEEN